MPLDGSAAYDVEPPRAVAPVRLDRTEEWATPVVTIATESHVEPTVWWDLELATGARRERQRAEAPGLDPARYQGRRVWATARDGVLVPVTVLHRADVPLDGTAPCLLYGYGA
jgi:oligopeptidase B